MKIRWGHGWPYTAAAPARQGGEWHLSVSSKGPDYPWVWLVTHSDNRSLTSGGTSSTPNFAKTQAETAAKHLDEQAP